MSMTKHAFRAYSENGLCVFTLDGKALLKDVFVELNCSRGLKIRLTDPEITEEEDGSILLRFSGSQHCESFEMRLASYGNTGCVSVNGLLTQHSHFSNPTFLADSGVTIHFQAVTEGETDFVGGDVQNTVWWPFPTHVKRLEDFPQCVQDVHFAVGDKHVCLLPLCDDMIRGAVNGDCITLSSGKNGDTRMSGVAFAISFADTPYAVVHQLFRDAHEAGWIHVPLKDKRAFPEPLRGLGFCTWNAFYEKVNENDILQKMEEFKANRIPIDWVLIDDGWSQLSGRTLAAFEENREKFPNGLAGTIRKLKQEFGVKHVGVWHAFGGYWNGISPDSALAKQFSDCFFAIPGGDLHLCPSEDKAFRFFDAWHTYLQAQGVDFIKVDNQSSYSRIIEGYEYSTRGVAAVHRALDRSAEKHFGGALINCMGTAMQDVLTRPLSAVNRNSNDYFPEHPAFTFVHHLVQNAWTAVCHREIHIADYDMFWSKTRTGTALSNAILRAMSGGPVYTSDPLCFGDPDIFRGFFGKDGTFEGYFPTAAVPTLDCYYHDVIKENLPLKLFNRTADGDMTVAAFATGDGEQSGVLRISDLPEHGEYDIFVAINHETGEAKEVSLWGEIPFTVTTQKPMLWNLYLVRQDAKVALGDETVYCGVLTAKREPVPFRPLLK